MTLRQTIQSAPGKTATLIEKLSETSNQAVKTRESLFAQLDDDLSRYVEIEEQQFLPMLRKHPGTKAIAIEALKGNMDLRTSLDKLSAMPKDTDDFLAGLDVLKKNFQKHVRNEREELLPAVLKAFSDEEAIDLASSNQNAVADADKAKREEKREKETVELAEAAKRSADRTQKATERAVREAGQDTANSLARGAAQVQEVASDVTARVKEQAQKVVADTRGAIDVYSKASQKLRDDALAIKASSTVSAGAVSELYSAWMGWFGSAAHINVNAVQDLMQCRTMQQLAEQQNAYATSALRNWMEGNAEILEIAQRSSKQALGPLSGRLSEVA